MSIITFSNVSKIYSNRNIQVQALKNINFNIGKGEFVALVGTSGSGKSTLLHILGGLDKQTEGKVIVDKVDIETLNDNQLSNYRMDKIGFIFQSFNLIPVLDVEENITLPCRMGKKKIDESYKNELLDILNLRSRINHLPSELSGGQQQRVAILRALLAKPSIILADEPTGNLDSKNSSEVIELLKHTSMKYNQTVMIVTHDKDIANKTSRIITMSDGGIVSDEVNII